MSFYILKSFIAFCQENNVEPTWENLNKYKKESH